MIVTIKPIASWSKRKWHTCQKCENKRDYVPYYDDSDDCEDEWPLCLHEFFMVILKDRLYIKSDAYCEPIRYLDKYSCTE